MTRGRPSRATVHARLDASLIELRERLGGLPSPREAQTIWSDIWHLEAHHSTALEGNTLVLREVEALLERGRAVGAKPLREYMEVQGYGDAASWVYENAVSEGDWRGGGLLTVHEIRRIHELAMGPVWQVAPHPEATPRESPGCYREHDIHPFSAGMTPPDWPLVDGMVRAWVDRINDPDGELATGDAPLAERLARAHNEFERIHPFLDGNGRTGRLVLNLLLVRHGYPPAIILKQRRAAYLDAMQAADSGDPGRLGEILARAMQENLDRFIVPNIAGPARMVPLAALADDEFSIAALRQAATRGRLAAVRSADGIWRSSRRAVDDYRRSKGRRGR